MNLRKFKSKMKDYSNISFPTPISPYVTSEVLVESFEVRPIKYPPRCRIIRLRLHPQAGDQIGQYVGSPGGKLQKSLAKAGVDVLLDMVRGREVGQTGGPSSMTIASCSCLCTILSTATSTREISWSRTPAWTTPSW